MLVCNGTSISLLETQKKREMLKSDDLKEKNFIFRLILYFVFEKRVN
jgi:hypothetical protein